MTTAIGQNTLTAVARHYILPTITDNIYGSNVLLYRLMKANKRIVQGGTQIEVPLLFQRFNSGGTYRGYDVLNTTPSDTIKNAVFDWKQHYVTWAIDGLTLLKADSSDAIANILKLQSQQAYMEIAENLANGLFGDGITDPKDINGLKGVVGTATVGDPNYGGISRSANSFWLSPVDAATTSLTLAALQSQYGSATVGGQSPTIILSRQDQYNKYISLNAGTGTTGYSAQYLRQPGGSDELLASAGFTNALYNNTPWVVDSHVPDAQSSGTGGATGFSRILLLNENVLGWVVSPRADFYLEDFQRPVNQDAFVATLMWAGNLVCMNCKLQTGLVALTS